MQKIFNSYWRKWTLACGAGELIGIGVAAAVAVGFVHFYGEPVTGSEKLLNIGAMLLAGALEGFVLGSFQWWVLKEKFPSIPKTGWIKYTMIIAMLGWFLGMLPTLLFTLKPPPEAVAPMYEPPVFLIIIGAAALGLILGAMFGLFQWFVFKDHAEEAIQWVTGNSLGWGVAMIWIFLAATLPDENTPTAWVLTGGVLAGMLAGLSVGAITGIYLQKIVAINERVVSR